MALFQQFRQFACPVHESNFQGLFGPDAATGKNQLFGFSPANQTGQALSAAGSRNNGQARFGQSHRSVGRGNANITGQGQFSSPAQCDAVHSRNHRFVEFFDGRKQISNRKYVFFHLLRFQGGPFFQISARTEGLLPCSRDDDDTHILAESIGGNLVSQSTQHGKIERIHHLRPIQLDRGNTVFLCHQQHFFTHPRPP